MARRLSTSCWLSLVLALGSSLGCGEDEDRTPPRGVERSGPAGEVAAPEVAAPVDPFAPQRQAPERRLMGPTEIREARENEGEATPVERDYSAELRVALGSPTSCGSLGAHTTRVTIRFSAVVTENGIVTRGNVSGPAMPPETLACLQGRLQRVRLRGDIEGAPRTISTSLELDPVAAPPTMEAAPAPAPAAAYGMGAQTIQGPEGQGIEAANSQMIQAAGSQMIEPTMGQTISGPSGTTIQGSGGVGIGR